MAVKKIDSKEHHKIQQKKRQIGALAGLGLLGLASTGGYLYYDEVYIPEQIEEALSAEDYNRFFEILPELSSNSYYHSPMIYEAITHMYENGDRLSDETFTYLLEEKYTNYLARILLGISVLDNDYERVREILTHGRMSISDIQINFNMYGDEPYPLERIQQTHASTPYSDVYALGILENAIKQDRTDIADWIKTTYTFEDVNFGNYLSRMNAEDINGILDGINLNDEQAFDILLNGITNTALFRYSIEHYEYTDEEYARIFETMSSRRISDGSLTLLLEQYTPSEDEITTAMTNAYAVRYNVNTFELFQTHFDTPDEIAHTHYLSLAERNDYRNIITAFNAIEDQTVKAQGYINAAAENNDEVMFVLDNANIELTQEQVDQAFRTAAENRHQAALLQIANNHHISEDVARSVIQSFIQNDNYGYNRIEYARDLERAITDFNRYYTILNAGQGTEQAPTAAPSAPITPRP